MNSGTGAAARSGSFPFSRALVRQPGSSLARGISRRNLRPDPLLALEQHAAYCRALAAAGLQVTVLPPDERFPDSCFVQDTAVVIHDLAILCRPGAPSRRGEEEPIGRWFAERGAAACRIEPPGTLEGGDIMVLPDKVLVGESERSNESGVQQLRRFLEPLSLPVIPVPIGANLHLLSAATYLGNNLVLAASDFADSPALAGLEVIFVPPEESYAANALALGERVILPDGFPQTAARLRAAGLNVLPVPLSEFEKVDGGATCLSILY